MDLRKAALHAHNSKAHFSPSHGSCMHTLKLTIQTGSYWCSEFPMQAAFAVACFYSQLWFTIWLADEFGHGFSCFIAMVCGGENGTNGCHLAVFSVDIAFACYFVVPHYPYRSAGLWYWLFSKSYLKWRAIKLAIHSPVAACVDRLWIAIASWQITYKHLFSFLRYMIL